jgi:hypothetical protein
VEKNSPWNNFQTGSTMPSKRCWPGFHAIVYKRQALKLKQANSISHLEQMLDRRLGEADTAMYYMANS